jgi:hypothetical protein
MENRAILKSELQGMGFKELVPDEFSGYIITSYLCPTKDKNFNFTQLYEKLSDKGKNVH